MKITGNFVLGLAVIAVVIGLIALLAPSNSADFSIVKGIPSDQTNVGNYFDEPVSHRGQKMLVLPKDIISTGRDSQDVQVLRDPTFLTVEKADETNYIFDDHYGLSIFDGEKYRFYSLAIMAWHEMAIDKIGEQPILITYSPLTDSFVPFEIDGEMNFEYSGFVWNNNSLMLDTNSGTLYSQILKRGVYGGDTGKHLEVYPHSVLTWNEWKIANPDGIVLSGLENSSIPYNVSPYGTYLTSKNISFPAAHQSNAGRRPKNALYTLTTEYGQKAYDIASIIVENDGIKNDTFGGDSFVLWIDNDGTLRANERGDERFTQLKKNILISSNGIQWTVDKDTKTLRSGDEERAPVFPMRIFWFAWASTFPETEIYGEVLGQGLIDGAFVVNQDEVVNEGAIKIEVDESGFDISDIEVN